MVNKGGRELGRVVGFELNSQDPEKAVKFYSTVFGWKITKPQWGYWPVKTGESKIQGINGGISRGPFDFPHGTRIQIEVDSIDDVITKAENSGAMVVRDKMEFNDFFLAYLVDPVGNGFCLIQRK